MKKILLSLVAIIAMATTVSAGENDGRIQVGVGLLYKNGMDLTVAYERETGYHNAWEYFANGYLKWADCETCGHVCPDSFWKNYRTWGAGIAYKPCVSRGKNHYGNLRLGGSLGSDTHSVVGGIHVGYEHSYSLRRKCELFWQVKSDLMIHGEDLFRTGAAVGIKFNASK
jgi:hypothetical protein